MKLALFGGTFDPIHNGHLTIAREAMARFGLEHVLIIPAAHPPHKFGGTRAGYEDRYRMVEIACASDPRLEASRLEAGARHSYSIHTIEKVRSRLSKEDELSFLIGADAFGEIKTWHRWADVGQAVKFIVVGRPGYEYAVPDGFRVARLDDINLPVSSSEIRRRLAAGEQDVPVPEGVLRYIRERGLYT